MLLKWPFCPNKKSKGDCLNVDTISLLTFPFSKYFSPSPSIVTAWQKIHTLNGDWSYDSLLPSNCVWLSKITHFTVGSSGEGWVLCFLPPQTKMYNLFEIKVAFCYIRCWCHMLNHLFLRTFAVFRLWFCTSMCKESHRLANRSCCSNFQRLVQHLKLFPAENDTKKRF